LSTFIGHGSCSSCGSKDNFASYRDDDGSVSGHCFGCQFTIPSRRWLSEHGDETPSSNTVSIKTAASSAFQPKERTVTKDFITPEQALEIKQKTQISANDYRGIRDETLKFYGVRTEVNDDGEVKARYYPVTVEDKLSGYKVREHPKQFYAVGNTGNDCDLYGAFRFRSGGKYLMIVEGEECAAAAYQMFKDYSASKQSDFVTAVVSITTGAGNPAKQIANNYDFLNLFDVIVIAMDKDEAGQKAVEKILPALPKGKARICTFSKYKDSNEYLINSAQKQFIADFYNAKAFIPAGVVSSASLYDKILEESVVEKVPFPPFLKKLEQMLGGGLILGHIYNIVAMTSVGKTAICNELIYYWIFNSPHMVGVVSMELSSAQYGETMLSRHIQTKLARLSPEDKKLQLESDSVREKGKDLFQKEDGSPRFYLVDDRDGTVAQIQEVIEQMVISAGVKVIVVDVLQDLIEGMSNEEQGLFMKWVKSVIKSHGVSFILVNHTRKKQNGDEGFTITESDVMGASQITKSASANILLSRNKNAECEIEKNTTTVTLAKSRITGDTGQAGKIYYDKYTHVMHDFDTYFENNPTARVEKPKQAIDF